LGAAGVSENVDQLSSATAASADGSLIVGSADDLDLDYQSAFRWQAGGDLIFFTDPSSGEASQAFDVSDDGEVVVGLTRGPSISGSAAYIWDEENGMRLIADVLTAEGIDLTDWTLTSAEGVSADGSIIVGNGIHGDGTREAWMANIGVVPIPPTVWLFGSGLLGLVGIARRKKAA